MTSVAHQQNVPTGTQNPGGATPTVTPVTGGKLGVPERPQVNLLPAEVTHRRQVAGAQRRLVWTVIITILVIVLAFGATMLVRANAEMRLQDALGEADSLMQQRKEYSPVIEVRDDITSTLAAREYVLLNEVNWTAYMYALAAVLPDDVVINSLTITGASAGEGLVTGADQLTTNAIAVMTFAGTSPDLPVASEWIDAIESVPGLADANLQSSTLSDEDGEEFYEVAATIQVTLDAAANREFTDLAPDAQAGAAAEGENAEEAASAAEGEE